MHKCYIEDWTYRIHLFTNNGSVIQWSVHFRFTSGTTFDCSFGSTLILNCATHSNPYNTVGRIWRKKIGSLPAPEVLASASCGFATVNSPSSLSLLLLLLRKLSLSSLWVSCKCPFCAYVSFFVSRILAFPACESSTQTHMHSLESGNTSYFKSLLHVLYISQDQYIS